MPAQVCGHPLHEDLMLPKSRWVVVLSLAVLALLPGQARAQARADVAQWDFDGSLDSTTGQPVLEARGAAGVEFETVDIKGTPADVAHFTRGTYFFVLHGFPGNGGGVYVNQFTLIMDVMFPDRSPSGGWAALLQTNCCNQNDADWFVNPDGGMGVSGTLGGAIQAGIWTRIARSVDLQAGTYTSYLDGAQVQQNLGSAPDMGVDGRFSLYTPTDPDPEDHFFIFADQSGEDAEGFVNSFQFRDSALGADEIAALG